MVKQILKKPNRNPCLSKSDDLQHKPQESANNRIDCAMQPYNALVSPYSQIYLNNPYEDFGSSNLTVPNNNGTFIPVSGTGDYLQVPLPYMNDCPPAVYLDRLASQNLCYPRLPYGYSPQSSVKKEPGTENGTSHIPCVEVKTENPLLVADTQSLYPLSNFLYKGHGEGLTIEERDMKMQTQNYRMNGFRQYDGFESAIGLLNQLKTITFIQSYIIDKGVDLDKLIERVTATQSYRLSVQRLRNNEKIILGVEEIERILKMENSTGISYEMQIKIAYLTADEVQYYSECLDIESFHKLRCLKRRLKNRHAARGCRKRKSDEHSELQSRVSVLRTVYVALRSIVTEFIDIGNNVCKKMKEKDPKVSVAFDYKKPIDDIEHEKDEFYKTQLKDANFEYFQLNNQLMNKNPQVLYNEFSVPSLSANITPISRVLPSVGAASVCTLKPNMYEYHQNHAKRRLFSDDDEEEDNLNSIGQKYFNNSCNQEDLLAQQNELTCNGGVSNGHVIKPSLKKPCVVPGDSYSNTSDLLSYNHIENYYTPYPASFYSNNQCMPMDQEQNFIEPSLNNCNDTQVQSMIKKMNLENPISKSMFGGMDSTLINVLANQNFCNSINKNESSVINDDTQMFVPQVKNVYKSGFGMSNRTHSDQVSQANIKALMK